MKYRQLTSEEGYLISAFRIEGFHQARIAARLATNAERGCTHFEGCIQAEVHAPPLLFEFDDAQRNGVVAVLF